MRRLDVVEDRPLRQVDREDVDAGITHRVELVGGRRLAVDTDDGRGPETEPGRRERRVRDAAAQPPSARIVGRDVARGRPDVDDLDGR